MIRIKNIDKSFNQEDISKDKIFDKFSLEIEEGTSLAILGANGSGKSTLLNLIAGSLELDSGRIEINGKDISKYSEEKRARFIGKVNQNPSLGVAPSLSVLENMSLALKKGEPFTLRRLIKKDNLEEIVDRLKTLNLGLEEKLDTKVKDLSGGQRQSLSLLMATIKHPELLLLDEHTAALDPKTSQLVMERTSRLIKSEKITSLMITHNLEDALKYADRIIILEEGRIVMDKTVDQVDLDHLNKYYGKIA